MLAGLRRIGRRALLERGLGQPSTHRGVVHVLYERLDFAHSRTFSYLVPALSFSSDSVPRQSLTQDRDERPVARQKDTVQLATFVDMLGRDIEPNESLTGTRNARNKADGLSGLGFR